jgi:hypothetical protein
MREQMRDDVPPPHAKRATLAALGLGFGAAGSLAAGTAAAGAKVGSTAASLVWAKCLIAGALIGTAVVVAVERTAPPPAPPPPVAIAEPAAQPPPARPSPGLAPPSDISSTNTAPLPAAPAVRAAPSHSAAVERVDEGAESNEIAAPPATTLRNQVLVIERARRMLLGGDAVGALAAINEYDQQFPSGVLQEEARVLEIEAYAKTGNRSKAVALARRWLAAHPVSAHRARLEALVSGGQ